MCLSGQRDEFEISFALLRASLNYNAYNLLIFFIFLGKVWRKVN